jgi:hypothetical protein
VQSLAIVYSRASSSPAPAPCIDRINIDAGGAAIRTNRRDDSNGPPETATTTIIRTYTDTLLSQACLGFLAFGI